MSRKIKVVPVDKFNLSTEIKSVHQEPLEIIAPVSWELSGETNLFHEQGILGNTVTRPLPLHERTYSINWRGSREDIRRVLNYFTKNNQRYFLLGNISDSEIISPSILFNSLGMLSSVAENQKFPGSTYRDYLPVYLADFGYNLGTSGIRVLEDSNNSTDFRFLDTSGSVNAFMLLEENVQYTMRITPNSYTNSTKIVNNLGFLVSEYTLGGGMDYPNSYVIRLSTSQLYTIPTSDSNRILRISLVVPTTISVEPHVRGILNYVPLIISKTGTNYDLDNYEDLPSLITPTNNYIYNIVSPTVAELSMNFLEVTHVPD